MNIQHVSATMSLYESVYLIDNQSIDAEPACTTILLNKPNCENNEGRDIQHRYRNTSSECSTLLKRKSEENECIDAECACTTILLDKPINRENNEGMDTQHRHRNTSSGECSALLKKRSRPSTPDLSSPRRARRYYKQLQAMMEKQSVKIRTLQQQNRRAERRIATLKDL